MKKLTVCVSLSYLVFSLSVMPGCDSKPADTPSKQTKPEAHDDHDHHEGDGHDHDDHKHGEDHDHDEKDGHEHKDDGHKHSHHPSHGPRGGHLIELGQEDYHAELVHDEASKRVGIYLLDARAKDSVASPMNELLLNLLVDGRPAQYKLLAAPANDGTSGNGSKFETTNEELCRLLTDGHAVSGRFNVLIDGKIFTGTIHHTGDHDHGPNEHHEARTEEPSHTVR